MSYQELSTVCRGVVSVVESVTEMVEEYRYVEVQGRF